ncbi:hypothetical protein SORBI_3K028000 [Sorghum bicolor]|uniref:Secreted protein n=1 Tax=Sorghum bicolor TaxID=4558 RepID=A0A109ND12_SORBI|nr:hypothetical protein SORBI_3K028000 [Sorghum bicolor]OQU75575.1 hypothetical protein SORBI_3K028000 [Sorghum bicolor]
MGCTMYAAQLLVSMLLSTWAKCTIRSRHHSYQSHQPVVHVLIRTVRPLCNTACSESCFAPVLFYFFNHLPFLVNVS